jgi:hypothetical protein
MMSGDDHDDSKVDDEEEAEEEVDNGLPYVCMTPNRHCTVEQAAQHIEKFKVPKGYEIADEKYFPGSWIRVWGALCVRKVKDPKTKEQVEETTKDGVVKLYYFCLATKNCISVTTLKVCARIAAIIG